MYQNVAPLFLKHRAASARSVARVNRYVSRAIIAPLLFADARGPRLNGSIRQFANRSPAVIIRCALPKSAWSPAFRLLNSCSLKVGLHALFHRFMAPLRDMNDFS